MHVLMVSFDHTMVAQDGKAPGDTRERHLKYAAALRQVYPDGHLTVLVKAPVSMFSHPVKLSDGLSVYPVACQRWTFAYKAIRAAQALLEKERFDVVTTQTPFDDGLLGVWLRRRFGIPLNVQMRSSFLDFSNWYDQRPVVYRVFNTLGKWVAHRADTIRVVSYGEKQRLEEKFPGLQSKISVLQPLVNLQTFLGPLQQSEKTQIQHTLKQHGIHKMPFLLFVGRLVTEKNLSTLLQAFAALRRKISEVSLVMAGDGPLRGDLEQLAKQLRLNGNILCLGNVPLQTLRGWYALASGTMLPSWQEGVAKVLLESYLMETPAIITPFVSARELIQDNVTGFITQSFTAPTELAEKMRRLLDSPDLAKEMGKKGKAHILNYILPEDVYMKHLIEIWERTADSE